MDYLAEKVDKCRLNRVVMFVYNWEHNKCPLYGEVGFPLFGDL